MGGNLGCTYGRERRLDLWMGTWVALMDGNLGCIYGYGWKHRFYIWVGT